MSGSPAIGGRPVATLRATDAPAEGAAFLEAHILPGRGMMLLQASLRLPTGEVIDAIHAPSAEAAAKALSGGPDDFNGDKSFSFGGALLVPYANRITGRRIEGARKIETKIAGKRVRLPRNWGASAARDDYAMHGLILDKAFEVEAPAPDRLVGRLQAGDFGCGWPGSAEIEVVWSLAGGRLGLSVEVFNAGAEPLPWGVGWHPYFALPSGDRTQARLHLPAGRRVEVNDYQSVLPTGRLLTTGGTPYDFSDPRGVALGERYLDDCFTDLPRPAGSVEARILDPAAGLGLSVTSSSPEVAAFQVYAPPTDAFVVIEPQFNLADPFSDVWPEGVATGMVEVSPGARSRYEAVVTAFAIRNS